MNLFKCYEVNYGIDYDPIMAEVNWIVNYYDGVIRNYCFEKADGDLKKALNKLSIEVQRFKDGIKGKIVYSELREAYKAFYHHTNR